MGKKASAKPLFVLEDPSLKGKEKVKKFSPYDISLKYDSRGRLVSAKSSGKIRGQSDAYSATLSLKPDIPEGSFSNSYGDIMNWRNGEAYFTGSYGPYEQESSEKITYKDWVQNTLVMMVGRNAS